MSGGARPAGMTNLVESPDGVLGAAVGGPLAADELPDPALQDAELVFQATRRESRLGSHPRHGLRRQLGSEPPRGGLRDEPRVHPEQEQEPKNRGRVERPVMRPTGAALPAPASHGRRLRWRPPGLGRGPHRRRPRRHGEVGPLPCGAGAAVAAEERGPPSLAGGGAREEPARGGRLGRADQVPHGVDAGEADVAGAVGVLAAPGVVAAVPRARRPRHGGGRRRPRGGGGGGGAGRV